MSLLINEEQIEIKVYYIRKNNKIEVLDLEKDPAADLSNYKLETFSFKRPGWGEIRSILSESVTITPSEEWKIDPWKYMDSRMKHLLKGWSLIDENEKKLPVTRDNIDRLEFELVSHLNKAIDTQFGEATSLT